MAATVLQGLGQHTTYSATSESLAPTTFTDVITAVPQLRSICCSDWKSTTSPGSGLKPMRLVSKHLRTAMLSVVQGYFLKLDGSATGLMDEMGLLQSTRLSRLTVCVTPVPHRKGMSPSSFTNCGFQCGNSHTVHLRCFLHVMASAIMGITRLVMYTNFLSSCSVEDVSQLLCLLAPACPALQELKVVGDISQTVPAAIGAFCSNVASLDVAGQTAAICKDTWKQVHLQLPRLTQCRLAPEANFMGVSLCHTPILSCSSLTSLDLFNCSLAADMWPLLPLGLRQLCCTLGRKLPAGLKTLGNLRRLTLYSQNLNSISLCNAVSVLRVAPNLQSLHLSGVVLPYVGCKMAHFEVPSGVSAESKTRTPDLIYLHALVVAGQAVRSTLRGGESYEGVMIALQNDRIGGFGDFITTLPPFPAFTGLILGGAHGEDISNITAGISATFPCLNALVVDIMATANPPEGVYLQGHNLMAVGSCSALKFLSLDRAYVSEKKLHELCLNLQFLKVLRLQDCSGESCKFSYSQGESLQSLLHATGVDVDVDVRMRYF